MKKISYLLMVLFLVLFSFNAHGYMDFATALTGGAVGSLDAIDGDTLAEADGALVVIDGTTYTYYLDASSGAGESSPDIIAPDSNPGTKRWILQIKVPSGKLQFPASQSASADANTVDDYEEGTWTPSLAFGGGTTDITYATRDGYYTKIGNIVSVTGTFVLTSNGTDAGAATITGLPFTVVNNASGAAAATVWLDTVSFANQHQHYAPINTTTVVLQEITEGGVISSLTQNEIPDACTVRVNVTYRVN